MWSPGISVKSDFACKDFSGSHNYGLEETGMKVLKADSLTIVLTTETITQRLIYRIQF